MYRWVIEVGVDIIDIKVNIVCSISVVCNRIMDKGEIFFIGVRLI